MYYRQDTRIVIYFTNGHCNALKLSLKDYLLRILIWFLQIIFSVILHKIPHNRLSIEHVRNYENLCTDLL
jgi:hypothetical protein